MAISGCEGLFTMAKLILAECGSFMHEDCMSYHAFIEHNYTDPPIT